VIEEEKLKWKEELKAACEHILLNRIETSALAMKHAQESANSDDKSSAGDKYETSRAMGQRDSDMHAGQLEQATRDLEFIRTIQTLRLHHQVGPGSVAVCKDLIFFMALGLGATIVDGKKVILLSPQAPIAAAMKMKKTGDRFVMNGKEIEILDVF
jgi:hypothetical protein